VVLLQAGWWWSCSCWGPGGKWWRRDEIGGWLDVEAVVVDVDVGVDVEAGVDVGVDGE